MKRIRRFLTARGDPIQPMTDRPNKGRRLSLQFNQELWDKLRQESREKSLPIALIVRDRLDGSYLREKLSNASNKASNNASNNVNNKGDHHEGLDARFAGRADQAGDPQAGAAWRSAEGDD